MLKMVLHWRARAIKVGTFEDEGLIEETRVYALIRQLRDVAVLGEMVAGHSREESRRVH